MNELKFKHHINKRFDIEIDVNELGKGVITLYHTPKNRELKKEEFNHSKRCIKFNFDLNESYEICKVCSENISDIKKMKWNPENEEYECLNCKKNEYFAKKTEHLKSEIDKMKEGTCITEKGTGEDGKDLIICKENGKINFYYISPPIIKK